MRHVVEALAAIPLAWPRRDDEAARRQARPPPPARPIDEAAMLETLGFSPAAIRRDTPRARQRGMPLSRLWIAESRLCPERWTQGLARRFGLRRAGAIEPERAACEEPSPGPAAFDAARLVALRQRPQRPSDWAIAPAGSDIAALAVPRPGDPPTHRPWILSPVALRAAMRHRFRDHLTARACDHLAETRPDLSARTNMSGSLALTGVLLTLLFALSLAIHGFGGLSPFALVAELILLANAGLRVLAVTQPLGGLNRKVPPPLCEGHLPRYAVLVPLYREAPVVEALLRSLARLNYPPERLAVLLLVEADDAETLAAIGQFRLPSNFECVSVPPSVPRTKPKALNYALATTDADLITIYDAEDHPDPNQLLRAAAAFAAGGERLGCLQASLVVDHARGAHTWISRQFRAEYIGQFDGLLPWLGAHGIPFPLGGTSTHLRRAALEDVGAWDPYNVTEDADLGMRLAAHGWRMDWLASWTLEEAPLRFRPWLSQRIRWFKGWIITWLVAMRRPLALWRAAGWRGLVGLHVVLGGGIMAAFVFPISVLALVGALLGVVPLLDDRTFTEDLWLALCLWTLIGGWVAPGLLAAEAAARHRRRLGWSTLLTMPAYWLCLSVAMALALAELIRRPHQWNKTTHGLARRPHYSSVASSPAPCQSQGGADKLPSSERV